MVNPLHTQSHAPPDQDRTASTTAGESKVKRTGFTKWIRQHFGSEPPHRHSENFFISDVTEGGIGSHHRHQLFRQDKRH